MSADLLAREAQEFLALGDADYSVKVEHARSYDWFYVRVFYRNDLIWSKACVRSYRSATWRARRVVRRHRRFVEAMAKEGARYGR